MSTALSSASDYVRLRTAQGQVCHAEEELAADYRWRRAAWSCRHVFPGNARHGAAVERSGRPDAHGRTGLRRRQRTQHCHDHRRSDRQEGADRLALKKCKKMRQFGKVIPQKAFIAALKLDRVGRNLFSAVTC